jgi:hypothetical protein
MSTKKNLVWDFLEPELEAAEARVNQAPTPTPPAATRAAEHPVGGDVLVSRASPRVVLPTFVLEHVATVGHQLLDLRGLGNFRVHILIPNGAHYHAVDWPDILSVHGARPGVCINSLTFEVRPPLDLAPRRFRFVKRMDYGEQIFNEVPQ